MSRGQGGKLMSDARSDLQAALETGIRDESVTVTIAGCSEYYSTYSTFCTNAG